MWKDAMASGVIGLCLDLATGSATIGWAVALGMFGLLLLARIGNSLNR